MQPADRMSRVEPSQTMAYGDKARKLRQAGEEVWDFTVGEPDLDTPAQIKEAAKEGLDEGYTKYTSSWGIPQLREAVAETVQRDNDLPATPDDVLVAPAKHLIFSAVVAYLESGDEVLVPTPTWVSYEPMTHIAGATPVPVPMDAEAGFRLDVDALADAVTPDTKAIFVNTPSNPTGAVQPRETLEAVADLCEDEDLLAITDELYARLTYGAEHVSLASIGDMWERTVTVDGFSKAFAMTGWRLGWAAAPRELLEPMNRVQSHSITCATAFAQYAGAKALDDPEEVFASMRKTFRERRDVVLDGLADVDRVTVREPEGAFYVFAEVDAPMTSSELALHLIDEAHVATIPGSAFGDAGEGYLRIAYTTSLEDCREGIERLGETLAEL